MDTNDRPTIIRTCRCENGHTFNRAVEYDPNAKFLLFCLADAKDEISKAVIAHEMSNASAVRQWLIKAEIIKPVDAFDEF